MNKMWSELNKIMQLQLKKKETFSIGIDTLLTLRKELMGEIIRLKDVLSKDEFSVIPFINEDGYHSKTIAYSLYHVFRIEDIVSNSLIRKKTQIYFANDYQNRMKSLIITTGNELIKKEIANFSSKLDLNELYKYILEVDKSTTELLKQLTYKDMKIKMTEADKERLYALRTVSDNENSIWLIDYWCGKNIQGLIQMPFSRHWIMHIEAILRIKNKIHVG